MAQKNNNRKGYINYFENNIVNAGPPILKQYYNYLSGVKGVSINTASNYYRDLILFFRFILDSRGKKFDFADFTPEKNYDKIIEIITPEIHEVFVHSIRREDVISFLHHMNLDNNLSPVSRNRRLTAIKGFFNYAEYELGIIDFNPTVHIPVARTEEKLPLYLNLEQCRRFLEAIPHDSKHFARDYCMMVFFLNFGLRLSELVGINITDVDVEAVRNKSDYSDDFIKQQCKIKIYGKGAKERILSFNRATLSSYLNYLDARTNYHIKTEERNALFISDAGKRISDKRVYDIVMEYIALAGLKGRGFTPHKLRHTAATLMYQYGNVDINTLKDVLGHKNIGTTQIYVHTSPELVGEATNRNPLSSFINNDSSPDSNTETTKDASTDIPIEDLQKENL